MNIKLILIAQHNLIKFDPKIIIELISLKRQIVIVSQLILIVFLFTHRLSGIDVFKICFQVQTLLEP